MSALLLSFPDIFNTDFSDDDQPLKIQKIVIPQIQRDYAQGRDNITVTNVRKHFLESLYKAVTVTESSICLDFIYGDIDAEGILTPLDGQQRLTTLFLLYCYAANAYALESGKNKLPEERDFLSKFTYETRYSSKCFCADLISHLPYSSQDIKSAVIDQPWFHKTWHSDPTISSMLTMLEAIHERFAEVFGLWEKLKNISFYFLPMKKMGLTDDLYIKMNSRGKPLTNFEQFKAEFERQLKEVDQKTNKENNQRISENIIKKIDGDWTDLLWKYCIDNDGLIDDPFLCYFRFICDIIGYRKYGQRKADADDFTLISSYFSKDCASAKQNLFFLERSFDVWLKLEHGQTPKEFLNSFMSNISSDKWSYEPNGQKIVVSGKIDIFEDCLFSFSPTNGNVRQFPLNRMVLLYAIVFYLMHKDKITYDDFVRRIRIVHNLISNSDDELAERRNRSRIPAILKQVNYIIRFGNLDNLPNSKNGFNTHQIEEEKAKIKLLSEKPELQENLYKLEDHPRLKGQVSIVGLDNLDLADNFISLFKCDLDKISCALMSIDFYGQKEANGRYQIGTPKNDSAWNSLFHKSANTGFEDTHRILVELLKKGPFTNDSLGQIAQDFMDRCEMENQYKWCYYYVKYPEFRSGGQGKLSNEKQEENPFLYLVLEGSRMFPHSTFLPYLKIVDSDHLDRNDYGQRLIYKDCYLVCKNDAFVLYDKDNEPFVVDGFYDHAKKMDYKNRVELLRKFLHNRGLIQL